MKTAAGDRGRNLIDENKARFDEKKKPILKQTHEQVRHRVAARAPGP